MAWKANSYVNLVAGLDNEDPRHVVKSAMDLPFQCLGFFVNCEEWPPVPYNDKFAEGAYACVTLYITDQANWQAQPPIAARALNAADKFLVLFRSNPFRAGLVSQENAAQEAQQATLYNVTNPVLFPLDQYGFLRFTRAVHTGVFQPSGPRQIAGRTSIDEQGGGGIRMHWLDNLPGLGAQSSIVVFTPQTAGTFPAGTTLGVWRWNKADILEVHAVDISTKAQWTLTFSAAMNATPVDGSNGTTMPCWNDYYGYQLYSSAASLQNLGVNVTYQTQCAVLAQLMMPDFMVVPTYSSKIRTLAAKLRIEYNGSQLPGPAGNVACAFGQNPNDWQSIYEAGLNGGSAYNACARYEKVSDHSDWANALNLATHCTIREEKEIAAIKQCWQVDLSQNQLKDEWFLLNETEDYRVVVINSPNTPNADGTNTDQSGQGCSFKYYFNWGIQYNTSMQSIPTLEPIDDLMDAWSLCLRMRKHVPTAVKGDYHWWTIIGNYNFGQNDELMARAYGRHLKTLEEGGGVGALVPYAAAA